MGTIQVDYTQLNQCTTSLETITIRDGDGINAVNDSSLERLESCTSKVSATSNHLSSTVSHYDNFLTSLAAAFAEQERHIQQQFDGYVSLEQTNAGSTVVPSGRPNASDGFFAI